MPWTLPGLPTAPDRRIQERGEFVITTNNFLGAISAWGIALAEIKEPLEDSVNIVLAAAEAVAPISAIVDDITAVAGIAASVTAVGAIDSAVSAVALIDDEVSAVAAIGVAVMAVAAIDDEVAGVYAIRANVTAVAGVAANVTTVADIAANVTTVAGIAANVTSVAGIHADVTAVAGIAAAVSAVAAIDDDVAICAANIADIQAAPDVAAALEAIAAGGNIYLSKAAQTAAASGIDESGFSLVLIDESASNHAKIYQKQSGVMTAVLDLSTGTPPDWADITGKPTFSTFGLSLADDANAAAALTTLGATTAGAALFGLANPGAITFLRINADNSVTARSAANFRTDIGLAIGSNVQAYDANLPTFPAGISTAEIGYLDGVTSAIQTQIDLKAPLASPALTGNPTAPTQTAGNNSTRVATTAYVDAAVNAIIAAADAMVYKNDIDCSASPNYPAADRGHVYRVSVAGKIGGASGPNVEVGDILICKTDSTAAGTHATVGANWNITQANIDGAVIGPASAVDSRVALFDGATGKLLKDSGVVLGSLASASSINGGNWSGTDLALADGGTGTSLTDPNADRIMFWDDSAGVVTWLTPNTGLAISGTNLNVDFSGYAPLAGPAFTGTPTAPTASAATNSTQIATTAYVQTEKQLTTTTSRTGYTLAATDAFRRVPATGTITVPQNSVAAIPVDSIIFIHNTNASGITITQGTGATITKEKDGSTGSGTLAAGRVLGLLKTGTNTFLAFGSGFS